MISRPTGPDFFIVGAPKCGTTSLHTYLAAHPDIFMAKKEQHFFGSDLASFWAKPNERSYFESFAGGAGARRRGEASGWYLLSESAAEEIHAYDPEAKIIAMFRSPLEMLPSLHSQALFDGTEDIVDFASALDAEADRRQGRRIPPGHSRDARRLLYRAVCRFDLQIQRYLRVFDTSQVLVILFEDLANNPEGTYQNVLSFLDVDPAFAPNFDVMNPQKRNRSQRLRRLTEQLRDPGSSVRRLGTRLLPHALRTRLLKHVVPALENANISYAPRPPLDADVLRRLSVELAPSVGRLSAILGRDLSHWLMDAPAEASPPLRTAILASPAGRAHP